MRTDLWVIVIALLVAVGFTSFEFGGFFPAKSLLKRARQKGWDAGFDAGFPHGARALGHDPDELADDELDDILDELRRWGIANAVPAWDDTAGHLEDLAQPYYEPLARGAGGPSSGTNSAPATTAPWQGGGQAPKGDSPGPDFPLPAETPEYPFPPAPLYDELATNWRSASSSTPYETPAPVVPSAGAGPEPPAPVRDPSPRSDDGLQEGFDSPIAAGTGAGADPWHQIAQANHDIWEIFDDQEVFDMIRWDIAALRRKLAEPYKLTPWKGATA